QKLICHQVKTPGPCCVMDHSRSPKSMPLQKQTANICVCACVCTVFESDNNLQLMAPVWACHSRCP
uniref:Uncharacterized protein n=1 Tax=Cynoglossus semilaevis TaxID=244447 RepID=A0A3P8UTT5_CYNSE